MPRPPQVITPQHRHTSPKRLAADGRKLRAMETITKGIRTRLLRQKTTQVPLAYAPALACSEPRSMRHLRALPEVEAVAVLAVQRVGLPGALVGVVAEAGPDRHTGLQKQKARFSAGFPFNDPCCLALLLVAA